MWHLRWCAGAEDGYLMQVFASTTCLGVGRTDLEEVLASLKSVGLDGIELGSTHRWRPDIAEVVRVHKPERLLTHNYFPPSPTDLVLNLASTDAGVRAASIRHALACVDFAADAGAELYTVHPGFLTPTAATTAMRRPDRGYDFVFGGAAVPYETAYVLMLDALAQLLSHAHRRGVRLAIETEGSATQPNVLLMQRPEEFRRLFADLDTQVWINLNLAHSTLAAAVHGFDLTALVRELAPRIAAVELSHNDGREDLHQALVGDSYVLRWAPSLPDVPLILEFREASTADVARSAELLRRAIASGRAVGGGGAS